MFKASMELPAGDEFSGRDRRDEKGLSSLRPSSFPRDLLRHSRLRWEMMSHANVDFVRLTFVRSF